jgi:hypothetical protein
VPLCVELIFVSEETSEDVRARAHAIQENEIQQLRDLTGLLDVEVNLVQQHLEVLQDVKSNWCDTCVAGIYMLFSTDCQVYDSSTLSTVDIPRANGPTHIFPRATDDTKSDSGHRKKSSKSGPSDVLDSSDSSGDDSTATASRKGSKHRRSGSGSRPNSRPPSRPNSRASRKRSDSAGTTGTEKERSDKLGKKTGVASWASSAVSSVTGRGKKDRDKFTTLTDDEDSDSDGGGLKRSSSSASFTKKHLRSKSKDSQANAPPRIPIRITKPPSLQGKKLVRALYDFTGSTDELTFKAGDEIVVLNEVLDGWWMGELDGHKGLFPTPYTEEISSSPAKLRASYRPERIGISPSPPDDSSRRSSLDADGYVSSDLGHGHLFDDGVTAIGRSPLYANFDTESVIDSAVEEDEKKRLMPARQPSEDGYDIYARSRTVSQPSPPPIKPRRSIPNLATTQAGTPKKAPPPPPPRRSAPNILAPPPIPQRGPSAGHSRSFSSINSSPHSSSVSSLGHDVSPFESATEIAITGCQNFRQNPFKPHGMCSNCSQVHI